MWVRKELKKSARGTLRRNYWSCVAVCFLIAMLTSAYASATSLFTQYDAARETTQQVQNQINGNNSAAVVRETLRNFFSGWEQKGSAAWKSTVDEFINSALSQNSTAVSFLKALNSIWGRYAGLAAVLLCIGVAVKVLYDIFVANLLFVGERRFYLENAAYPQTQIRRMFYLYPLRAVRNPAWVMLWRSICTTLWWFTVVGGPIKSYEYALVPYILAENPDAERKAAFRLSKSMMQGSKWQAFLLDLSFAGWAVLSFFTFGLLDAFYTNPYHAGAWAQLYLQLRAKALADGNADAQALCNDPWLVPADKPAAPAAESAAAEASATAGAPVAEQASSLAAPAAVETAAAAEMPAAEASALAGAAAGAAAQPLRYPVQLFPRPALLPRPPRHDFGADRAYSLEDCILLFFTFSIMGWLWEVGIHLVKDGTFVNRGVLLGPWLPIYGTGGVIILVLLRRFLKKPAAEFILIMVVCSAVEYFTSWALEETKGIKWWDYSGYFMNLNGRICLLSAVVFGLGGCAFLYVLAPVFSDYYKKHLPPRTRTILCVVLCCVFAVDVAHSVYKPNTGKGITDYPTSSVSQSVSQAASGSAAQNSAA